MLRNEIARLHEEIDRRAHARPLFRHCATRYLSESKNKRSASDIAWHVRLLLHHFGDMEPDRIHDGTLQAFIEIRLSEGASPTTVNRSLEVMRTILNRAARAYRDDDGRPWLERLPPLITMLPESPRPPCPISWEEQDAIFKRLPVITRGADSSAQASSRLQIEQLLGVELPAMTVRLVEIRVCGTL